MDSYNFTNCTDSPVKVSLSKEKIILFTLNVLTAVFHVGGIIVLVRLRSHLNQILIIMNLAIMELVACLKNPILHPNVTKVLVPYMTLAVFSDLAIRLIMLVLLADRFLEIFLNIRYPVLITKGRIFKIICIVWIVSGVYGLVVTMFTVYGDHEASVKLRMYHSFYVHNYINVIVDAIFTISAIITYYYFYVKIRDISMKDNFQRCSGPQKERRDRQFNYKIPFRTVGTFLTFNVSADIFLQIITYKRKTSNRENSTSYQLLDTIAFSLQTCGYLSDAIVYIAMQKSVRKLFQRKITPYENNA